MRKLLELFRRAFGVTGLQEELRHLEEELRHLGKRLANLEAQTNLEMKWRGILPARSTLCCGGIISMRC